MASRRATPDRAGARPYVRLRVRTNSGVEVPIDQQSARQIEAQKDQTIAKLEQELRTNQYQPQAVKRVWIPKPGSQEKRPLGVSTVVSYCTSFNGLLGSTAF